MGSILRAMVPLMQIGLLTLFTIILFSIVGLEFYAGIFQWTCYKLDADGNVTNEIYDDYAGEPVPCFQTDDPFNVTADDVPAGAFVCPANVSVCARGWIGPNYGITSFDHIGVAMVTVFQCVTMEGCIGPTTRWARLSIGSSSCRSS